METENTVFKGNIGGMVQINDKHTAIIPFYLLFIDQVFLQVVSGFFHGLYPITSDFMIDDYQ